MISDSMQLMLAQLFGAEGDPIYTLISWGIFILIILVIQKLMVTMTIFKLEKDVIQLEEIAKKAKIVVSRPIPNKKKVKKAIDSFMEFFAIPPLETDPYGIMKKIDHVINNSEHRFKYFVKQIAPSFSKEEQMNLKNAFAGAMTTYQIAKIARHFLEITKKYKLIQLALILQMQIPLIARISKAASKATEAFVKGMPIGDGIGPLVAANMIKGKARAFKDEEFVLSEIKVNGRKVLVAKADGPGATTGHPGKLIQKLFKAKKINRVITVDAGMRLEGEKIGSVAQGVGVAIGGAGVDRYEIEEVAVKNNIPLDAVIVKVSDEEALMPMKKEIVNSVDKAVDAIKETIARAKRNENIIILGVGNTCGIGNNVRAAKEIEKKVKRYAKKLEREKKK